MTTEKEFPSGFNPLVLHQSIGKRFAETVSGKGGLSGLLMFMRQLDFVEGVVPLLNDISHKTMFYDTALTKCAKEALKRPESLREEEIAQMLGYSCNQCGKTQPIMSHHRARYCDCGGRFTLTFLLIHRALRALAIIPTPEAVLMTVAYDGLADAYVEAFTAFRMVLQQISERMNWAGPWEFVDDELKDQLDSSFLYLKPGDTRISIEEREILQLITRGNTSAPPIDLRTAEKLIRLGVAVCKFGHLYNQLFCPGANLQFIDAQAEFSKLYSEVNEKIRLSTVVNRREHEKRTIQVEELPEKQYYTCALLPAVFWQSGKLWQNLVLKPITKLPVYTTFKDCAVNAFIAPSGKGKTTFMANIVCDAVEREHEIVFNVLGDESNSLTLASIPLFPCEGRTGKLLESLSETGSKPHTIPCITLTFLREGEEIKKDNIEANPPTVFDYIVDIPAPWHFGFKFESGKRSKESPGVVDILRAEALKMGYSDACGLVNVRNLSRLETSMDREGANADIEIATVLLDKFVDWRENRKKPSARILVDEASYLAPVQYAVAGRDTSKSSATLSSTIKKVRKKNTSFDLGSQKFSELNIEARAEILNLFFRELSQSGDRSRSQRDVVLDSLLLKEGKALREQIAMMMEKGVFPDSEFFWYWWNKNRRDIQVVKPTVPFFMLNQPKLTNREVFREYEKFSGETVLRESWDQVPHLKYEATGYQGPPSQRRLSQVFKA